MSVVRWTHKACTIALVAVALALAGCGSRQGASTGTVAPAAKDVSITACGRDAALGTGSARGVIRNTSGHRADYVVHIDFLDPAGAVVDSALHADSGLDAGAQATFTATGVGSYPDRVTCKITKVDRTLGS
jgi:hypothetical protein